MNLRQTSRTTLTMLLLVFTIFSPRLTFADINGSVQSDIRLRLDPQEWTRNENRFTLKFEGNPADSNHYYVETELRGLRLLNEEETYEWDISLTEAYLDLYKFLSDKVDVRIGKQIIAWGTADKLNPTSNICPDDFSDTFDFGAQTGVNLVNTTVYLTDNTALNLIFVPEFTPATLPTGDLAQVFASGMDFPSNIIPHTIAQVNTYPERTLDESSQFAAKLSGMVKSLDVSLSYYYGRDDLPVPGSVRLFPLDAVGTTDIDVELRYPRLHVIGADFAGSVKSVGVWGEAALFLPEKVEMNTYLELLGTEQLQATVVSQEDDPYVKFVLGGDYTFENGWYVNSQFLHGFFHERSQDELHDYVMARLEKKLFHDELKIVPLGGAIAITDWDDIGNNYAIVGNPELTYSPADSVELIFGAFIITGKGENIFSQMKDQDQLYFKAKVSF